MGAKLIVTFGISKNFESYIKNYYKNKKNLVPKEARYVYVNKVNKERKIVEKYLNQKFRVKIINN